MSYKSYKYRIKELLDKLPHADHRTAINALPGILEVTPKTFENYRNIKKTAPQDIPHAAVVKMEAFFGIGPGELANYTIDVKPIGDHSYESTDEIAARFNLKKPE